MKTNLLDDPNTPKMTKKSGISKIFHICVGSQKLNKKKIAEKLAS